MLPYLSLLSRKPTKPCCGIGLQVSSALSRPFDVLPERMVSLDFAAQPPSSVVCGSGLHTAIVRKDGFGNIIRTQGQLVQLDAVGDQGQPVPMLGDNATGFIGESADFPLIVFTRCASCSHQSIHSLPYQCVI